MVIPTKHRDKLWNRKRDLVISTSSIQRISTRSIQRISVFIENLLMLISY